MIVVVLCAACGVGKTTVGKELQRRSHAHFACIDSDEVGINWWDYAGTDHESRYHDDCFAEAVRRASGHNLLFTSCLNPYDYYGKVSIPDAVQATYFVAMTCSDSEVVKRLKARPPERMCGDDAFIRTQTDYNAWFRRNRGKFQLYIDNTDMSVADTALEVERFLDQLTDGK